MASLIVRSPTACGMVPAQVNRETLVEVAHAVDVYDTAMHTGNEALDIVLTEKGLVCRREGITLTSIADGTSLLFMHAADVYTLVGGLLDHAIEAARAVRDQERRTVSLSVRQAAGMATVHVECFCGGATPDIAENSPVWLVTERYGGFMMTSLDDDVLTLDAALPTPEE